MNYSSGEVAGFYLKSAINMSSSKSIAGSCVADGRKGFFPSAWFFNKNFK